MIVREFLAKRSTNQDVRYLMEATTSYDPAVWKQAAEELGLHGLTIPARHGGSGASAAERGVVFEEMGAALYCGPFLATVGLAATALLEIGDEIAAAAYLPGIASGATIATLWEAAGTVGELGLQGRASTSSTGTGLVIDVP